MDIGEKIASLECSLEEKGAILCILNFKFENITINACSDIFNAGTHKTSSVLKRLVDIGFLIRVRNKGNIVITEINKEFFNELQ